MLRWIIRKLSIRGKIVAITMITSLVAVVVACALFIWYDEDRFRAKMKEDIKVVAEGLVINSTPALELTRETGLAGSHSDRMAASRSISANDSRTRSSRASASQPRTVTATTVAIIGLARRSVTS